METIGGGLVTGGTKAAVSGVGPGVLEPFQHQVAGQSLVFRYDGDTICKSLIAKELRVYQTLPEVLRPFVPEYRGVVDIALNNLPTSTKEAELEEEANDDDDNNDADDSAKKKIREKVREKGSERKMNGELGKDGGRDRKLEEKKKKDEEEDEEEKEKETNNMRGLTLRATKKDRTDNNSGVEEVEKIVNGGIVEEKTAEEEEDNGKCEVKKKEQEDERAKRLERDLGERRRVEEKVEHPLTTQRLLKKLSKRQGHDNVYHFLLLENIVAGFQSPCILDLKLGTRQHGDDAPLHKVQYQVNKCRNTTSASLGVRLCGMKVYQSETGQYVNVDKMEGRSLREEDFRQTMRHFLYNGRHIRQDLIPAMLEELQAMKATISGVSSFRFYGCSLLIVYDAFQELHCMCKNNILLKRCSLKSSNPTSDQTSDCCELNEQCKCDSTIPVGNRDVLTKQTGATCDLNLQDNSCAGYIDIQNNREMNGQSFTESHTSSVLKSPPKSFKDGVQTDGRNSAQHFNSVGNKHSETSIMKNPEIHSTIKCHGQLQSDDVIPKCKECGKSAIAADSGKEKISRERHDRCSRKPVDARIVDFAHATHAGLGEDAVVHQGPDQGCLLGLSTLIDIFTAMERDTNHTCLSNSVAKLV